MEVGLVEAVNALVTVASTLDADRLSGEDAVRLAVVAAKGERVCSAAKVLLARRASECGSWRGSGHRSAGEWLGNISGTSTAAAQAQLETAQRAATQPDVEEALKAGELSSVQAEKISKAVEADPSAAPRLVEEARNESLAALRRSCLAVEAAARSAEDDRERAKRTHAGRYLKTWIDDEGAGRLEARLSPDGLARVEAALTPFETEVIDAARREGRREPFPAYSADALVAMAAAAAAGGGDRPDGRPAAQIIVRVDYAALVRGSTVAGEMCEIDGLGPVPVATVRALFGDAAVDIVVADGVDVRSVIHLGRVPTRAQRTALMVRDPVCVVPDCSVSHGLEIDHVEPWTLTHTTRIDGLARLCHHHHAAKTYDGWRLTGGPGHWRFDPPDQAGGPTPDQTARQRKPPSPPPKPPDADGRATKTRPPPGSTRNSTRRPARTTDRGKSRPDPRFDRGPDPFP